MKKIWKYAINCNSVFNGDHTVSIKTKVGAKPLSVLNQNGLVCVWFEVDTTRKDHDYTLYCVGTGFGVVPNGKTFLGTVIDDEYVWHIYY